MVVLGAKPTPSRSAVWFQGRRLHNKKHLLSSHNLTNPAHLLLPLPCLGGGLLGVQSHKVGSASGDAPGYSPQALLPALAPHRYQIFVTLDSNLICPGLPCWKLWLEGLAQLLALSPLKSVQPCAQPGLLEHKHGLRAVLGGQVETMCEVVLPP